MPCRVCAAQPSSHQSNHTWFSSVPPHSAVSPLSVHWPSKWPIAGDSEVRAARTMVKDAVPTNPGIGIHGNTAFAEQSSSRLPYCPPDPCKARFLFSFCNSASVRSVPSPEQRPWSRFDRLSSKNPSRKSCPWATSQGFHATQA